MKKFEEMTEWVVVAVVVADVVVVVVVVWVLALTHYLNTCCPAVDR